MKCIHESSVAVVLGALVALLVRSLGGKIVFSESSFFLFILPPIIFAAGFTLKSRNFLSNFGFIALYGIVGTISAMVLLGLLLYGWGLVIPSARGQDTLLLSDSLLLATVLCATDTVAAVAVIKERDYPKLNSIVFGESVVNDAVSILLFRAVSYHSDDDSVVLLSATFLYLSLMSILIGITVGLLASLILKHMPSLQAYPVREMFFLILVAYLGYVVSEVAHFSGIITLFCSGFTMAHYGYYNISQAS